MADNEITVDVSGGFNPDAIGPLADAIKARWVATLGAQARSEWVRIAQANLRTMRGSYIDGLSQPETDENQSVIVLAGAVANRIEQGYQAYDMHDTLLGDRVPVVPPRRGLKGKHESVNKPGVFYRTIPFRAATPGTVGEVGPAMGSAYSGMLGDAAAFELGERVHRMAKALVASKERPGGKTAFRGRLQDGMAPLLRPHHKSDIYAGMYKMRKMYNGKMQNSYMTFRTISTGSDGWRVAAQQGKHFAQQVAAFINENAADTFRQVVSAMDRR